MSPSMLSTRSLVVREDTPLLTNVHVQRSPIPSVTTRTAGFPGIRENGFATPKSHGRSAIYSMARTPYSRIRQTDVQKVCLRSVYFDVGNPLCVTGLFCPKIDLLSRLPAQEIMSTVGLHHLRQCRSTMYFLVLNRCSLQITILLF